MSDLEKEQTSGSGQAILGLRVFSRRLFKQVLSTVFGSIMVIQILAHFPMTDINMSSNVLEVFQMMIDMVSFDYFPPFEYIDVHFSDAWAWSPNFDFVGYGTV